MAKAIKKIVMRLDEAHVDIKLILLTIGLYALFFAILLLLGIISRQSFVDALNSASQWSWLLSIQVFLLFILFFLKDKVKIIKAVFTEVAGSLYGVFILLTSFALAGLFFVFWDSQLEPVKKLAYVIVIAILLFTTILLKKIFIAMEHIRNSREKIYLISYLLLYVGLTYLPHVMTRKGTLLQLLR